MDHYTVICVIYCTAIEQQQQFGSRPHTHTHKYMYSHTGTHMLCLQSGSNRGCECISRYSPSVKCWPGVCEIDDGRVVPHPRLYTHKHAHRCDIQPGVRGRTQTPTVYICLCLYKNVLKKIFSAYYTFTCTHSYTDSVLSCDCRDCCQAPVVYRQFGSALMPTAC